MDKLRALTFFCRVVGTRSFVSAARAMDVAPSVLSKAIAALEQDLSFRLFHRTTRQVMVTEEGARYHDACKRLLVELEEAETVTRDAVGHPVRRLVVGDASGDQRAADAQCQPLPGGLSRYRS